MISNIKYMLAMFAAFTLIAFSSVSAQVVYQISGKVVDKNTKEPLPGATVVFKESGRGTTTNAKGAFQISGIRSVSDSLKFSFIGYLPKTVKIDFRLGVPDPFVISLEQSATQLEQVQIKGRAEGQIKAMLEQKLAVNIKNVVSSEQIEQFPDMNAAEAMQRIPGVTLQRDQGEGRYVQLRGTPPELTNFNINGEQIPSPEGDVRYVGMDIVAADQIDQIEITKVLTPDMDATGIGGTVNIVTKRAESDIPEIRATVAGGYNNLRETDNYNLQFSYAQRHGKFGFVMNSSYYINNQGSDNMEYKYTKDTFYGNQQDSVNNYYLQYREVQLRHYDITRERTGLSATLDYEFNDNSYIYLRGMHNNFKDDETRRRRIYELDDALSNKYYLYGGIVHDLKAREKNQTINSLNLGGEHHVFGATIDYEFAYSTASEKQPDRLEAAFENPGQYLAIKFNLDDPEWPRATFPQAEGSADAFDYENYEMDELLFEDHLNTDKNLTARMDVKVPYNFNIKNFGYIKFGGKARFKNKERNIWSSSYTAYFPESNIYPLSGPDFTLGTVMGSFTERNLLDRNYVMSNMPSEGKVRDFFEFHRQLFIYGDEGITETRLKSFGEDYTARENIYAGYLMFRHDIGKFTAVGGVRYEKTDVDYEGRRIFLRAGNGYYGSMDTLTDARSRDYLLPQFQIKYSPIHDFNLRAAVTQTYSRPNFRDIIPSREDDRDEVSYGDPSLNYTTSWNFDVLAEYYLKDGGIISGGLFYKKLKDFIFYYKLFGKEQLAETNDDNAGSTGGSEILIEIPRNGQQAHVYGAEFQAQFKFDFLPGFLKDFGLFSTYTYTFSEAYINKRYPANNHDYRIRFGGDYDLYFATDEKEKLTLPGQAMHTLNLALFYDSKKFYAKLSGNYHDDFLYKLGADPDLDEYYGEAFHLDFTANYAITENIRIFTDLINLNNAPLKYYLGQPGTVKQQEFYSWWGRLGFKMDI